MKNLFLTIIISFSFIFCKAQAPANAPIISLSTATSDSFKVINNGAYFKDTDNKFEQWVGTWQYQNGNTLFKIVIEKVEGVYFPLNSGHFINPITCYVDLLVGKYYYEENGVVISNHLTYVDPKTAPLYFNYPNNINPAPTGGNNCNDTFYQKDPLVNTIWAQGATYNNLISLNCSNSSGGKAPTGCVATAMAQVMKYHQKPVNYNWSNMPYNYGTSDTQLLMKNIGLAVGMDYGCSSSGADTTTDVASAFNNDFNYHGATYTCNYSTSIITQQLNLNKPVILRGGRKRNGITWPWNYYTGGHAWVCDGYQSMMIYFRDDAGNCTGGGNGYLFLHMNWGWGGYCNGWYNAHNFNPASSTFNYKRGIVYNITPN